MANSVALRSAIRSLNTAFRGGRVDSRAVSHALAVISEARDQRLGIRTLGPRDIIPPFVTKTIQYTSTSTMPDRLTEMWRTGYNVFKVKAGTIFIDLLTDSGTGAQSDEQWAEILSADERYAHSVTYEKFIPIARDIFGKRYILPVHQGRAGENIAFSVLLQTLIKKAKEAGKTVVCTGNTFFDTTVGNANHQGALVVDATCPESQKTDKYYPFKGNADVDQIKQIIKEYGPENVGFIVMTVVNNTIGGQPVSMANLKAVKELAREHGILFILDAARIFENAYFIKKREKGYSRKSIKDIVREMAGLADIILMSAKKDAIANMGGLIATNDKRLYTLFQTLGILIEGHYSYGGLSGRDLAALGQGLEEGINEDYLRSRINQVTELGNGFRRLGIPIQWPPGSNGIYMDARKFLPEVDPLFFPAQRLCTEIYIRYGIRPVEIGLSLAGRDANGIKVIPPTDLVRFTIPRRVLTGDHMAYILACLEELYDLRDRIGGLVYDKEGLGNGHFTSTFLPVSRYQISRLRGEVKEYFSRPLATYASDYLPPNARKVYGNKSAL